MSEVQEERELGNIVMSQEEFGSYTGLVGSAMIRALTTLLEEEGVLQKDFVVNKFTSEDADFIQKLNDKFNTERSMAIEASIRGNFASEEELEEMMKSFLEGKVDENGEEINEDGEETTNTNSQDSSPQS